MYIYIYIYILLYLYFLWGEDFAWGKARGCYDVLVGVIAGSDVLGGPIAPLDLTRRHLLDVAFEGE